MSSAPGEWAAEAAGARHLISLFPSATSPHWEGFARIVNLSDEPGTVRIRGVDDAGIEYGPVELSLQARAVTHFNSGDLESGNPDKGPSVGLGDGDGDWRLDLETDLDIEPLSYIRTHDGFVTAMHEVVPREDGRHYVRFFNPGSNRSQVSSLRLVNPTAERVVVTIEGRDDDGAAAPGGTVRLTLEPGTARMVSAPALESGGEGLAGALGDGRGKWQLFVSATGALHVLNLLQSPTGHLSNLSAPGTRFGGGDEAARTHVLALFLSASNPHREGFARIINHSDAPGTLRILGIDDAGTEYGPVELSLEASAVTHFNSGDLESGNSDKGLSAGLGDGDGDWRLQLETELDIEPLSYVRTEDGFVTAMHQVAPSEGLRHQVRFFNPGGNRSQVSHLRLVNPTAESVAVTIEGRDDSGATGPAGAVRLTLEPGTARMVSAQALESGGAGLAGALGDGRGKWQLLVSAGGAVNVMSLLQSPTGHLSNLSAPYTPDTDPLPDDDPTCEGADDTVVDIPDSKLRAAIASALRKRVDQPVTRAEMAALTVLDTSQDTYHRYGDFVSYAIALEILGVDVESLLRRLLATLDENETDLLSRLTLFLKGLEETGLDAKYLSKSLYPTFRVEALFWYGLLRLHAARVDIASLLESLLARFDGSEPGIRSLKGLGCATGLQELNLLFNAISDVSPLSGLKSLWKLDLSANEISDISPLESITSLRELDLAANDISDVSRLAGLAGLKDLDLAGNGISTLASLAALTDLARVNLSGNEISNISPLAGLTKLEWAVLGPNRISNVSPLSGLARLEGLFLDGNRLTDVSALSGLTALGSLGLSDNEVSDILPLSGLTGLNLLLIGGNPIADISPLARLSSLVSLGLWGSGISDLTPLAGLTNLSSLDLADNEISDISRLTGLTGLTGLDLTANAISDVSLLVRLPRLGLVWLGENRISNIEPLVSGAGLPFLGILDLRLNPLSMTARSSHIPSLRSRGVLVLH